MIGTTQTPYSTVSVIVIVPQKKAISSAATSWRSASEDSEQSNKPSDLSSLDKRCRRRA